MTTDEPCPTGKVEHATAKAALRAGRGRHNRRRVRAYPCPLCGTFHVTSTPIEQPHRRKGTSR